MVIDNLLILNKIDNINILLYNIIIGYNFGSAFMASLPFCQYLACSLTNHPAHRISESECIYQGLDVIW